MTKVARVLGWIAGSAAATDSILHISDMHVDPFYDNVSLGHDNLGYCRSKESISYGIHYMRRIRADDIELGETSIEEAYAKYGDGPFPANPVTYKTCKLDGIQVPAQLGRFGCNPPMAAWEQVLSDIRMVAEGNQTADSVNIRAAYVTGDIGTHAIEFAEIRNELARQEFRFVLMRDVLGALRTTLDTLPGGSTIPLVYVLGNNDVQPDYGTPHSDYYQELLEKVLQRSSVAAWGLERGTPAARSFGLCGFYAADLPVGLPARRVVVLNTNVWSTGHWKHDQKEEGQQILDREDPCGQFAFLEAELSRETERLISDCNGNDACLQNGQLHILAHMPPVLTSTNDDRTADGDTEIVPEFAAKFGSIVRKYPLAARFMLAGHTHMPSIAVLPAKTRPGFDHAASQFDPEASRVSDASLWLPEAHWQHAEDRRIKKSHVKGSASLESLYMMTVLTSGSVSPVFFNNPSYNLYSFTPVSGTNLLTLSDIRTRHAELYPNRRLGTYAQPQDYPADGLLFKDLLSSVKELELSSILPAEAGGLFALAGQGKEAFFSDEVAVKLWRWRKSGSIAVSPSVVGGCARQTLVGQEVEDCVIRQLVFFRATANLARKEMGLSASFRDDGLSVTSLMSERARMQIWSRSETQILEVMSLPSSSVGFLKTLRGLDKVRIPTDLQSAMASLMSAVEDVGSFAEIHHDEHEHDAWEI